MVLKLRKPLVFFDVESTGLSTTTDRIVEASFLKLMPNGEKKSLTKRFNPGMPIPREVSLIHGIYDEDVKDAPRFAAVARTLAQFLEGCDLGGFNLLKFDIPILMEEFLRSDVDFDLGTRHIVDAQKIYHLMEPRTLGAAYKFYCQKELENAHSAEADTLATYAVLEAQIALYEGKTVKDEKSGKEYMPVENDIAALHKLTLSKNVDLAGRIVYNAQGEEVINFGKHKDKPVAWVIKYEPQYYDWFMKSDFPLESKKKFTEIKLREFAKIKG